MCQLSENQARIIGIGSFLPKKVLTNADLEKMVETSDEWIVSRTGIKERRIANQNETTSFMGTKAGLKAIEKSGLDPSQIDFIIVATMTPDFLSPGVATLIQEEIKAFNAAALDIQAACTGFIYGLSLAKAYIDSGIYQNILVVASEKMSSVVDYTDRNTCVLFGDGACAAVVSNKGDGFLIDSVCLGADGRQASIGGIPAGGSVSPASEYTVKNRLHYFKMEGKEVFKHAVRRMGAAAKECLDKANLKDTDISWLVPHQANIRILDAMAKQLHLASDRVYKTVDKYGNTSASSVGIALENLLREKPVSVGDHLLLIAFGVGLTWGSLILTKVGKLKESD